MTTPPEQVKARAYLKERGTDAPIAEIRERVADAFATMDALLESVDAARAARRPGDRDWSVQEVVDHLVETHPRALEEMRALIDDRHSPVSPIPAGLQSAHPMARPWDGLRATLHRLHREVLAGGRGVEHVGLRNVDARLRQVYGDEHGLVVETAVGAGTLVRMRVPKAQPRPEASVDDRMEP